MRRSGGGESTERFRDRPEATPDGVAMYERRGGWGREAQGKEGGVCRAGNAKHADEYGMSKHITAPHTVGFHNGWDHHGVLGDNKS